MNKKNLATNPPSKKHGWDHSEQVLVYYPKSETSLDGWGIAYYHYNPPFQLPRWIDWDNVERTPLYWWILPNITEEF